MGQGLAQNSYYGVLNNIYIAALTFYTNALFLAVTKEKKPNKEVGKPEDQFTVSGDGTWKNGVFHLYLASKHTLQNIPVK